MDGTVDVAGVSCASCHGAPPPAPHVQSTACGSCHDGYGPSTANPATHRNGTVDVVLGSGSCTSCHGAPPSSGRHWTHRSEGVACGSCHPGYTSSSVAGTTHLDGVKTVGGSSGWNATSRSCSNGCHGNERW